MIVEDDEVADALHLEGCARIVILARCVGDFSGRKQVDQPRDRGLDQVNAGRFKRFDETGRQTDGDDVAYPGLASSSGLEAYRTRIGERLAVKIGEQSCCRFVLANRTRL